VRQTTAHDLQAASQEMLAEGVVPTDEAVAARAALKRARRTERKLTWYTVGQTLLLVVVFKLPELVAWADAHKETAGGLVGLLGILGGGYLFLTRLRPPDDQPPSGGPPA
jgi:hypothetical protein